PAAAGFSDLAADGSEIYELTITFGTNTMAPSAPKLRVRFVEDAGSFIAATTQQLARVDIVFTNNLSAPIGAFASMLTNAATGPILGIPMGVDVEFMITGINAAVTNECDRFNQTMTAISGSNVDAGNGEDSTTLSCYYNLPPMLT